MKKTFIILLISVVIFLVGCQAGPGDNVVEFNAQYIRTNGYVDGVTYPITTVIDSREELDAYYAVNRDTYDMERKEEVASDSTIGFLDAIDQYDDAYFQDNVLVLVLVEEGSGSIRHEVTEVKQMDTVIEIRIKRDVPEMGTDDMAEWHIMVELARESYDTEEIRVILE